MRQVDLDELTYMIFSGLRAWKPSRRARLFAPIAKRQDVYYEISADELAHHMRNWTVVDSRGREVDREQLSAEIRKALLALPGAIAGLWTSGVQDREREARAAAAIWIARALGSFEILSDTVLDQHGARVVRFNVLSAPPYAFAPHWP